MSRPLRILHLTASLYTGGAERLILGLVRQLNRTEFDVHLCAIGRFGQDSMLGDFQQLDRPIHLIPIQRFYDPRILVALVQYVRHHQIDLIHTHLLYADILGRLVGQLLGLPVVSTLQNDPTDSRNTRLDKRWLSRLTAHFTTTHLVTVSNEIRQRFIAAWQVKEERISTIYNAVQMQPFLAIPVLTPAEPIASPLTITTIGRLEAQKGQHLLLAAAKQVLAQFANVCFLFVGQGPLDEQLQTQAAQLGIADRVEFAGLRRDIPTILAQSDIFVLPSLWEGLPLAAIEAMAAARPVILTDVGGNRELITHEQEGLLIPPNDCVALTAALLGLLHSPEKRQKLGEQARAHARQHFHIDIITRQYEALYRALCQGQPAPQRHSNANVALRSAHE